jgi:hypothetical protein
VARAQREDDNSYEELPPDFWRSKFLRMQSDVVRVYRAEICWRPDGKDTRPIGYHYPQAEWRQIKDVFPEYDERIDAKTRRLRSEASS